MYTYIITEVCHDRLTEADTPQEEIDEELAVIATQLAYTYQRQGRVDDAMEIYQSVIDSGYVIYAVLFLFLQKF